MNASEVYHYPPELLALLIDTVPKLCRSKRDLLTFFRGAGVDRQLLGGYERLLSSDAARFQKYTVAREILTKINDAGDQSLRERREVVKRVAQFDDFSVCWPADQSVARGLVAQVRELVNVKDSFTRMRLEKEEEQRKRVQAREVGVAVEKARREELARIKTDLFGLFANIDAHARGKRLEAVLNALFSIQGLLIREAFTIKGSCAEGVIEQIDGLVEIDGHLYLVEFKWWNSPLGTAEVSPHLVRVYNRGGQVRGIFISYSDFTAPAITTCREAIAGGAVVVLCKLQEIVELLGREGDLRAWLKAKIAAAVVDKNPLHSPPV